MHYAYSLGKEAFHRGAKIDENPFAYGTAEYTYWWDAWTDQADLSTWLDK